LNKLRLFLALNNTRNQQVNIFPLIIKAEWKRAVDIIKAKEGHLSALYADTLDNYADSVIILML
jgi:hypothetical protein